LGALKLWVDEVSGRINTDQRGIYLGAFDTGDLIIALYADGTYVLHQPDPVLKIDINQLIHVSKLIEDTVVTAVHYDGEKDTTMVKRFKIETSTLNEKMFFIKEHNKSKLLYATTKPGIEIEYYLTVKNTKEFWRIHLDDFIDVKGWKAIGNRLCNKMIKGVREIHEIPAEPKDMDTDPTIGFKPGDTIELDF
jgi:topoisomerase-4 subunit A